MTTKERTEKLLELALAQFDELKPAEQDMLKAAAEGQPADFADETDEKNDPAHADEWGEERIIRAGVIRWLCADKQSSGLVDPRGIRVDYAKIEGELDLAFLTVGFPILFFRCSIPAGIQLFHARTRFLSFEGSHTTSITADGLQADGAIFLNRGFIAKGDVRLLGAKIAGSLNCIGSRFENENGNALSADGAEIGGDVFLREGFIAKGEVRLPGAKIAGNLECAGSRFENENGDALSADGAEIGGDLFLSEGFIAKGEVRLLGAKIGGDLDCTGSRFENENGDALRAHRAEIGGSVFLRKGFSAKGEVRFLCARIGADFDCSGGSFANPAGDALVIEGAEVRQALFMGEGFSSEGSINLGHCNVGQLADDKDSWPSKGRLVLDGFVYRQFAGDNTPTSAKERLDWLGRQADKPFYPQPYEQLASILKHMGHNNGAKKVLAAREDARRRHGDLRPAAWIWNLLLGCTIRHGYALHRVAFATIMLVGLGSMLFDIAHNLDLMSPSKERVYMSQVYIDGRELPKPYPKFNAFIYSLDTLLPIVDLHQENYWLPDATRVCEEADGWLLSKLSKGSFFRCYLWIHIGCGWVLASLLVIGLTNLVRKE